MKITTPILALAMLMCLSTACSGGKIDPQPNPPRGENTAEPSDAPPNDEKKTEPSENALVIGVGSTFDGKWNPFLVESAYDRQVVDEIFEPICELDAKGELVDRAGSVNYAANEDGTVLYTIKIHEGMAYSDGAPVTIDDYIWAMKVRADPSYAGGPQSLLGSNIVGVKNYFYDAPDCEEAIKKIEEEGEKKYAPEKLSLEDFTTYAKGTNLDGWWGGNPAGEAGGGLTWLAYIESEGGESAAKIPGIDASSAEQVFALLIEVEYKNYVKQYPAKQWLIDNDKSEFAKKNLAGGVNVPEISGINKVDDYTCTVLTSEAGMYDNRSLTASNGCGNLIPRHHYGEIKKGDISNILSNMSPLGSGPYAWGGFEGGVATGEANTAYWQGAPKIGTVRWQSLPRPEILPMLASGEIDIATPDGSKQNIDEMKSKGIGYDLIESAGYGFMGMNTETTDVNVRRGLCSLMNRKPYIGAYYGEGSGLAGPIERPMAAALAEYPGDAVEMYPYSRDKALEYFEKAGYSKGADGKLAGADGGQLALNVYVAAGGDGSHPAFPMLAQARDDMAALGGELQIHDCEFDALNAARDDGTADAWVMAWGSVYSCDKTEQFHSGGSQNGYRFKNAEMDRLLKDITKTIDLPARRELVAEMLDFAMDQAIEYPLYQWNGIIAYNKKVDMGTIPESTLTFDYKNVLWKVEML